MRFIQKIVKLISSQEEEKEEHPLLVMDREFIKERTLMLAKELNIPLKFENNFPTKESRLQIASLYYFSTNEDLVLVNEIKLGLSLKFWNRLNLSNFFINWFDEYGIDNGFEKLKGRPILLDKAIILHVQHPLFLRKEVHDKLNELIQQSQSMKKKNLIAETVNLSFSRALEKENLIPL